MDTKEIEHNIKTLESALSVSEENVAWLDANEKKTDEGWEYKLSNEERNRFRSIAGKGGEIHSAVHNTKQQWNVLLKEELKLKREYSQQVKLDRTIKTNSLVLRIFTAFSVITASVLTLNIATHYGFSVPWLVSRNITATNLNALPVREVPNVQKNENKEADPVTKQPNIKKPYNKAIKKDV